MNAIDTNILIYAVDRSEPEKRATARKLLRDLRVQSQTTFLLWQVAGEFLRQLRYWQDQKVISPQTAERYLTLYRRVFPLVMPTPAVLDRALELTHRFSLSHWDSMIIAACLDAHVETLYTEDMGAPITLEGVQLVNPFV